MKKECGKKKIIYLSFSSFNSSLFFLFYYIFLFLLLLLKSFKSLSFSLSCNGVVLSLPGPSPLREPDQAECRIVPWPWKSRWLPGHNRRWHSCWRWKWRWWGRASALFSWIWLPQPHEWARWPPNHRQQWDRFDEDLRYAKFQIFSLIPWRSTTLRGLGFLSWF